VEEATKVSERTLRRSLEQKKHEAQGPSYSSQGKTHKVPKRVTDIDGISLCEHVDELEKQLCERKGISEQKIEIIIIADNGMSSSDSESNELNIRGKKIRQQFEIRTCDWYYQTLNYFKLRVKIIATCCGSTHWVQFSSYGLYFLEADNDTSHK
jgi:hypothetical protein